MLASAVVMFFFSFCLNWTYFCIINLYVHWHCRVYHHLEDGIAFSTVEGLLESMDAGFVDLTKKTIREVLKEDGFSDLFIDELVTAGMRVNYGQGADVHGFVGRRH